MTDHRRLDDRDVARWIEEVTDDWRMPDLRSDQLPWQARIDAVERTRELAPERCRGSSPRSRLGS
jgi:hypothetical protein